MLRDDAVSAAEGNVLASELKHEWFDKDVAVVWFKEQSNHLSGETDVSNVLL